MTRQATHRHKGRRAAVNWRLQYGVSRSLHGGIEVVPGISALRLLAEDVVSRIGAEGHRIANAAIDERFLAFRRPC